MNRRTCVFFAVVGAPLIALAVGAAILVLGAMSGTSAAFDARGRLLLWQPHQLTGAFVVTVPLVRVDTPYVRVGDWPLWLATAVAACTAGAAVLRRAVHHRADAPP